MIVIVPSFRSASAVPLLSGLDVTQVGPFVAGMPVEAPLWMGRLLHQRSLAQIQLLDWLSPHELTTVLQEEKSSSMLTTRLPFYYWEIARALPTGVLPKASQIVLQDILTVRLDKLRQHFHELSKTELQEILEQELPAVQVTGIGSVELQTMGPFLQRAFSDLSHLLLLEPSSKEDNESGGIDRRIEAGQENLGMDTSAGKGTNDGDASSSKEYRRFAKPSNILKARLRQFRS